MLDWGHVWRWKRSLREVPPVDFCTDIKLWEWSSSQCLIAPCQNWCHISATMAKIEPPFGKHEARCWLVDTFWNIKPLGFLSSCCDCDDRNSLQFIGFFGQRSTHSTVIRLDQARCSDGTQHLSARPWPLGGALVGTRCYNRSILWKSEKSESWRIRSFVWHFLTYKRKQQWQGLWQTYLVLRSLAGFIHWVYHIWQHWTEISSLNTAFARDECQHLD